MKIFCDTSLLVAASAGAHEHHERAVAVVQRVAGKKDEGTIAAHSLAETYAVLTRLPISPRIQPAEAQQILETNILQHFSVQTLTARDYAAVIRDAARAGVIGGPVYDLLLLACARKADVQRIYTLNVIEFRRLAPDLTTAITAP